MSDTQNISGESTTADISISSTALQHIAHQLEQTQAKFLRLGVKQSGCNGFMYMLDYLEEQGGDDTCFDFEQDVQLCVSKADLPMVKGTEIDMITQGLNSALVFKNSKATSYCGCGESFAFDAPGSGEDASATTDLDPSQLGTPASS